MLEATRSTPSVSLRLASSLLFTAIGPTLANGQIEQEVTMLPPGPYWTQEDPAGFDGALDVTVSIPGTGFHMDLPTRSELVLDEPRIYALSDIPGGAWVIEDLSAPDTWDLAVGGATVPLTWDPVDFAFEANVGTFAVQIHYEKQAQASTPSNKSALYWTCRDGSYSGTYIELVPSQPEIPKTIEFYQFFTLKVRYEGRNDAGAEVTGDAPPGTEVKLEAGNPTTPASGDGTRSYCDAPYGNDGQYPDSTANSDGGAMQDSPQGGHMGSVIWPAPGKPVPVITKIIIERRFTTYVICDFAVAYVYEWDVVTEITEDMGIPVIKHTPGGPGPGNKPTVSTGGSVAGHHISALISNLSTSSPNRDPGVPLPPGHSR